MLLEATKVRK